MLRSILRFLASSSAIVLAALLYQNCGPGFQAGDLSDTTAVFESLDPQSAPCFFNGQAIGPSMSVVAFKYPTAATIGDCADQTRICKNGVLSGSYTNPTCSIVKVGNCTLGSKEIMNGADATGYLTSQVAAGQTCASVSTSATCQNGELKPKVYSTCSVAKATSCQFHDQLIPNGFSVTAYSESTVPSGTSCSSEARICQNGNLSGTFSAETCTTTTGGKCTLGRDSIANGTSAQVYSKSLVPYGESCATEQKSVTCRDGSLFFADGSLATNRFSTGCAASTITTCSFAGKTLQSGESLSGYLQATVPLGQTCALTTATCKGGIMIDSSAGGTGSLPDRGTLFPTCEVGGCQLDGTTIPNQKTISAYSAALVGKSQTCASVQTTLTCQNGKLLDPSGVAVDNHSTTCRRASSADCAFRNSANGAPTNVTVLSGQTLIGYSSSSVPEGSTCDFLQEKVSCNDGVISFEKVSQTVNQDNDFYFYSTCNVGACKISNQQVLDGATVLAYPTDSVAYGQSCSSIQATLTCKNRTLYNGTTAIRNYIATCTPMPTPDCQVEDWSNSLSKIDIKNGQSVTGYSIESVPSSDSCDKYKLTLSCTNGLTSKNGDKPEIFYGIFFTKCQSR